MAVAIHHRLTEGIEILDLQGRLIIGEEDAALRNELQRLLRAGKQKLILNLKQVTDLDSAGLGTLTFASTTFSDAGGKVVLLHLHPSHMELVVLFKLEMVFEVFDDETEAVNSFFPERAVKRVDVLSLVRSFKRQSASENEPFRKS